MSEELDVVHEAQPVTEIVVDGKKRKVRPNGDLYSSDPKERYQQLLEDGRVGPQFGRLGGRPRKPRAAEAIAEHARKEADRIIQAYDQALDSEDHRIAMQAADSLVKIEREEASLQLQEDEFEQLSAREQAEQLKELLEDPALAALIGDIEE